MRIWASWASHLIYVRGLGVYVFGLAFAARFISGSLLDTNVAGEALWTRFEWAFEKPLKKYTHARDERS